MILHQQLGAKATLQMRRYCKIGAVAMSIGNIGYIGTGYDGNYLKDFGLIIPSLDTFTAR
jgi:hypothetical protein